MQDLLTAGVHFGHQVRRGHPRMSQFVYGARDGVQIIDLAKTESKLKEAAEFVYNLGKSGGVLLVVGTKKQSREIVEQLSKEADTPFMNDHWVGGLLTNFDEIKKNLKRLNDLKEEQATGSLSRYTKREQLLIARKLQKYERDFGGVANLVKLPDALFVIDTVSDNIAVKEASVLGIKVVGFADSNSNPDLLDYPIPANDDGIKSIKIISETIIKSYGEGKKVGGVTVAKVEEAKSENEATKKEKSPSTQNAQDKEEAKLDEAVAEEAAAIEEVVEKKAVEESERKV